MSGSIVLIVFDLLSKTIINLQFVPHKNIRLENRQTIGKAINHHFKLFFLLINIAQKDTLDLFQIRLYMTEELICSEKIVEKPGRPSSIDN